MTYNSDDQRTVPAILLGITAQSWSGPSVTIDNKENPNLGPPTTGAPPGFDSPGYPSAGNPGLNNVLVPNTDGNGATGANIETIGPLNIPAGGGLSAWTPASANAAGRTAQSNILNEDASELHLSAAAGSGVTQSGNTFSGLHTATTIATVTATGGAAPYAYSAMYGLPAGVTLVAGTGVVAGSSTAVAGAYSVLVEASDAAGKVSVIELTLNLS